MQTIPDTFEAILQQIDDTFAANPTLAEDAGAQGVRAIVAELPERLQRYPHFDEVKIVQMANLLWNGICSSISIGMGGESTLDLMLSMVLQDGPQYWVLFEPPVPA